VYKRLGRKNNASKGVHMHTPYKVSDRDGIIENPLMNNVPRIHSYDGAGAIHHVLYSREKIHIPSTLKEYITLMRPKQYLKNIFVFAPLFFALPMGNPEPFLNALTAFIVFSIMASAVYILNHYRPK